MLKVVTPVAVTDAVLVASNLLETDPGIFEWSSLISYPPGARVILASTHKLYEAIEYGSGQSPDDADSDYWVEVGATLRWRAFDGKLSDLAANPSGDVTYTLLLPELVDTIAFLNVDAGAVRVIVKNNASVVTFDETRSLVDRSGIVTWFQWFFEPIAYETEAVISGIPGFVAHTVEITVDGPSAGVGEIVIGRSAILGRLLDGTEVGFKDYSVKDRDDFGNATIVVRPFIDEARYSIAFDTRDTNRVSRLLKSLRATAAVYYADSSDNAPGTTVFGFPGDFSAPLKVNLTFATLQVEGLV